MMENMPVKVSVIVLTYNHEKYIRQALDSILMQKTDFHYEILVGDDASSDKTPDILLEYKHKYPDVIRLFLRKKNVGATRNAYQLFMKANGNYIATCEGDDYWIGPDKLAIQVAFLEQNPIFIGCSHSCVIVDEFGHKQKKQLLRWECRKQIMSLKDFKGYYLAGQASTLVRRNIYKKEKNRDFSVFYKAHPMIGDRTTALIYLSEGNFYRINKQMSCYRITSNSESITAKVYGKSGKQLETELVYLNKLQEYAETVLEVDAGFDYYRCDLFVSALFKLIFRKSNLEPHIIYRILENASSKVRLLAQAPFAIIRKIIYRIYYF